jgi:hypothetical protein
MRPPAHFVHAWIRQTDSFPEHGLVMLRHRTKGWSCNIAILRVAPERLTELSADDAAFDVALSAVCSYINTGAGYSGEMVPIVAVSGKEVPIPAIALQMAPFLVERIKKILEDGGGAMPMNQIALSQRRLAKQTLGSAGASKQYGLPKVLSNDELRAKNWATL